MILANLFVQVPAPIPALVVVIITLSFSSLVEGCGQGIFVMGNVMASFERERGGQRALPESAVSQAPHLKIISMPKRRTLGRCVLNPFSVNALLTLIDRVLSEM